MVYYRNRQTGQVVERSAPWPRLERLDGWERVEMTEQGAVGTVAAPSFTRRPIVWLSSPAHGRLAVSELVFAQRADLIRRLDGMGITAHAVIVADDENLDLAREHKFATVEMSNAYLGRKTNAGFRYACVEGDADFVVALGSDDWMHESAFEKLPGPTTIVAGRKLAVVDLEHGRMRGTVIRHRYGVIPWILPRFLLETRKFEPIKPEKRRGLDGSLVRGVTGPGRPRWLFHDPHELARVDFKTRWNITPYRQTVQLVGVGPEYTDPWRRLAELYPAELCELARATHERIAREELVA